MKPLIIASKKDPAGMNIVENLKKLNCKIPIYLTENELIHAESIDENLEADFIIFASKHQSIKNIPSLTVHTVGNFGEAKFGGQKQKLCPASSKLTKHFFQNLSKNSKKLDYEISLEVTHHGPLIKTPCLFIEIGSVLSQWKDKKAGEIIAKTILDSLSSFQEKNFLTAIGIGGPHYCPNFNQIQLEKKYAISYIFPQYNLPLTEYLVKEAISKTKEKVDLFIVDWKGLGNLEIKNQTLKTLEKFNLPIFKTKQAKSVN